MVDDDGIPMCPYTNAHFLLSGVNSENYSIFNNPGHRGMGTPGAQGQIVLWGVTILSPHYVGFVVYDNGTCAMMRQMVHMT